jgi:hypothetical protein
MSSLFCQKNWRGGNRDGRFDFGSVFVRPLWVANFAETSPSSPKGFHLRQGYGGQDGGTGLRGRRN